ncbi:GerAB/ArcD/ProY family transporter [Robertmurraya massiliosenegalensis]|uniref:GerAB/ArcD/ProY family transporter n=1 Tax=Robertmurraya TaxID=2837507 RepID=UPI0039A6EA2B
MEHKLRYISVVYMILLSVGLFAHVEIIPFLLRIAKRDSWITILLTVIILPVWINLLYKIVAIVKTRSIIQLMRDHGSTFSYYMLFLPLCFYMLMSAFVTAKDIIFWSQLSYMQGFNSFILAFVLLIFCLLATESGLFSIGLLSSILCPLVILFGFFISFANMGKKHYELLLPLFSDGYLPMMQGFFYTSLPIFELFIIIFLTPVLKKVISNKQLLLVGLVIIGLMLGPTVGAITEFGPKQSAEFQFPAYEEWRLIAIGRYFSHADFFAIFQWLSGGVIRISLFIFITSRILTKGETNAKVVRGIYTILLIACSYPIAQSLYTSIVYEYFRPLSFVLLTVQISIFTVYVMKHKQMWSGGKIES